MVKEKFSIETLRSLMNLKYNVRNMCVIAHVDHGKSTLTDSLVASNGIISVEHTGKRIMDTRPDEQARVITIKSTGITLHYELPEHVRLPHLADGRTFLVNLIDSPGHVDFSSEVTAALRLTDGALVLVDCVEGCCVQTETVLRQALAERIKPILAINKLDRAFEELKLSPEDMYQNFVKAIAQVNNIIDTYHDEVLGDCMVDPIKGTVAFSAGKQGWAFTLKQFAQMLAKRNNSSEERMLQRLWGEHYYDHEANKWTTSPFSQSGKKLSRGFCEFILEPINKIFEACQSNDKTKLEPLLAKIGVTLKPSEMEGEPKNLIKLIMSRWLPAGETILEMIAVHLPSPATAQKYRAELLYQGPLDDETAESIRNCDPNGPLVVFISKMVPDKTNSHFFAFGRVFSGTVTCQKVNILGPSYVPGKKEDYFEGKMIQRTMIMMGGSQEPIDSVPCGNTVALVGIDQYINKSCTLTDNRKSFPLVNMKYSVAPVVRVAVKPKNKQYMANFVEALKKLSKSDPLVHIVLEPNGEHVIGCAGDLHLEICLKDLQDFLGENCGLSVSEPVVPYQETVTTTSIPALSKSANRHNRLYVVAEPLSPELTVAIENGEIGAQDDYKLRASKLAKEFSWDAAEARKIWAFGPEGQGTNILCDLTKAIAYMNEIKDSVVVGFQESTKYGVLCDETLRGVKFSIVDALLHGDAIHRGPGQIIPTARRAVSGSQLLANPRLMEPVFLVEIQCPNNALASVYNVLNQRRGSVIEAVQRGGTPTFNVKAYLPVKESFGFTEFLRAQTSGRAFPQCVFDHWQLINEDPLEAGTKANQIVTEVRARKGLAPQVLPLDYYVDKL